MSVASMVVPNFSPSQHAARALVFSGPPQVQSWREVQGMLNHPHGAAHVGLWAALAIIASQSAVRGFLVDQERRPLDIDAIAALCGGGVSAGLVIETIERLVDRGILEQRKVPALLAGIVEFIEEACAIGPDRWVRSSEFRTAYLRWCRAHKEQAVAEKQIQPMLDSLGFKFSRSRRERGVQIRTFEGFCVTGVTAALETPCHL